MIYSGIGSRESPLDVCALMERTARALQKAGWTLRSGHAPGADQAFERGGLPRAEIYLPWADFEGPTLETFRSFMGAETLLSIAPTDAAADLAVKYEGRRLRKPSVLRLKARNAQIVLGLHLDKPADLVICWTPGGVDAGGTAHALRIARDRQIPILNLGHGLVRLAVQDRVERMERGEEVSWF